MRHDLQVMCLEDIRMVYLLMFCDFCSPSGQVCFVQCELDVSCCGYCGLVFRAVQTWCIVLWILWTCVLSVNLSEMSIFDMMRK